MFNEEADTIQSMLELGIRPLSDFPDSDRWQLLQQHMPGMFETIYQDFAFPVIQKPYQNSGVFVTPIDFYKMPDSILANKGRIAIPHERIDPTWTVVTYELDSTRESLPFTPQTMQSVADTWREDVVREWFAKDNSKVFFYVPQIATYKTGGIPITEADIQRPT